MIVIGNSYVYKIANLLAITFIYDHVHSNRWVLVIL